MELPLTPLDLLARARRLFPDRVGVIEGEQRWTYEEYAARCHRQAQKEFTLYRSLTSIANGVIIRT